MRGTPYNEMLSAHLAGQMEIELNILDGHGNGAGTVFSIASRSLNEVDYQKFVAAYRRKAKMLRKQANGCPSRVADWLSYYNAELPDDSSGERVVGGGE